MQNAPSRENAVCLASTTASASHSATFRCVVTPLCRPDPPSSEPELESVQASDWSVSRNLSHVVVGGWAGSSKGVRELTHHVIELAEEVREVCLSLV